MVDADHHRAPGAPVVAVVAGVAEFVPYIFPIIAAIPAVAVTLTDWPAQAAIVALAYLALQQIDSHLIVPNIMGPLTTVHRPR